MNDRTFWLLFGGIWLLVGAAFLGVSFGVNLFADPAMLNSDTPLWVFVLAGLASSALGGVILWRALALAARDKRLMLSGVALTASVTDITRSMIEINRQTRWHVVYRYEYTKGQTLTGKSRALPGDNVADFKPGDKVAIKVNPQKPQESLFVGRT